MIINPIIPIWVMVIICIFLLLMKRKGGAAFVRQIFIVILLFVINLRIMTQSGDIPLVEPRVDVLFVVDNTISMIAEDYGPEKKQRLDAVRDDCEYIMKNLPGATYAVYSFNTHMEQMLPYTSDSAAVLDCIEICNGGSRYSSQGTSLNMAMGSMEKILDDDREFFQVIFFISDGEIVSSDTLKSYPELKKYIDGGAVLGYGTEEGGIMVPVEWYEEEEGARPLEYYDDNFNLQTALSVIDEKNLQSIASDFGVEYIHMTDKSQVDGVLAELQGKIANLEMMVNTESTEGYEDINFWFVIPLTVLLVVDAICYKRKV